MCRVPMSKQSDDIIPGPTRRAVFFVGQSHNGRRRVLRVDAAEDVDRGAHQAVVIEHPVARRRPDASARLSSLSTSKGAAQLSRDDDSTCVG